MNTFLSATLGLLPLILFWTLSGFGTPAVGLALGLAGAVLLNVWRARTEGVRLLEVAVLATLGLIAIAFLAAPDLARPRAVAASFAAMGVFFLATVVAGRPWTADYSRAAFGPVAKDKAFLQINALISGVWGLVFVVYAAGLHLGWPIWTLIAVTIAAKAATIVGPGLLARALLIRRAHLRRAARGRGRQGARRRATRRSRWLLSSLEPHAVAQWRAAAIPLRFRRA